MAHLQQSFMFDYFFGVLYTHCVKLGSVGHWPFGLSQISGWDVYLGGGGISLHTDPRLHHIHPLSRFPSLGKLDDLGWWPPASFGIARQISRPWIQSFASFDMEFQLQHLTLLAMLRLLSQGEDVAGFSKDLFVISISFWTCVVRVQCC